jgi:hypothetical protein
MLNLRWIAHEYSTTARLFLYRRQYGHFGFGPSIPLLPENGVLTKFKRAEPAGLVNLVKMRLFGQFDMLLPSAPAAYPRIYDERS